MFEGSNELQQRLWAPVFTALEQVVDAIAAVPLDAQLEHRLMNTPNLWRDFAALFRQRHSTIWQTLGEANLARCRAASEAKRAETKKAGLEKRKATLARRKAASEARQRQQYR